MNASCVSTPRAQATATTLRSKIEPFIDRVIDGQSGWLAIGWCEGNPKVDDVQQRLIHTSQREEAINFLIEQEAKHGDIYVRQCLFQRITELTKRGDEVQSLSADYAHAMPSRLIWKDDAAPDTPASLLIETSPSNYQALIVLDRPASASERKRLMTEWRRVRGGDAGPSVNAVAFIRIPGGRNTKPGKLNHRVRILADSDRTYSTDKLLAKCQPGRESTHSPDTLSGDWRELPDGEALWNSPRWQMLARVRRPQLKKLLIDKEPIALPNTRTNSAVDSSWSNQRAVFVKNCLEAYDPPTLDEIRAVAWYFKEYLGARKSDLQYQIDIDRLIAKNLHELYAQRGKEYQPTPTGYIPSQQRTTAPSTPRALRGRASSHAALIERVYTELRSVGDDRGVQIKIGAVADAIGVDRRTISTILGELVAAGRIEKRHQVGQHSGVYIAFSGRIYSAATEAEYRNDTPQTDETTANTVESTSTNQEDQACVYSLSPAADLASAPDLQALAAEYLDAYIEAPIERLDKRSGEIQEIAYKHTAKRFADLVVAEFPQVAHADAAAAYKTEIERRAAPIRAERRQFLARLKAMSNDELIDYIAGKCRAELIELARERHDKAAFDKALYRWRHNCALKQLGWRGLKMPEKRTGTQASAEQSHRDVAEHTRAQRKAARPVACQPVRYEQPKAETPLEYAALARTMAARFRANPPQLKAGAV